MLLQEYESTHIVNEWAPFTASIVIINYGAAEKRARYSVATHLPQLPTIVHKCWELTRKQTSFDNDGSKTDCYHHYCLLSVPL